MCRYLCFKGIVTNSVALTVAQIFGLGHFITTACAQMSISTSPHAEYQQLEHQLDQLDAALTHIESKRDQLHEEALLLLQEAKEVRSANLQEQELSESAN